MSETVTAASPEAVANLKARVDTLEGRADGQTALTAELRNDFNDKMSSVVLFADGLSRRISAVSDRLDIVLDRLKAVEDKLGGTPPPPPPVVFEGFFARAGEWNEYGGKDGHVLCATPHEQSVGVSFLEAKAHVWASNTADERALRLPTGERSAACRYNMVFGFTAPAGVVTLYMLDWDRNGRHQKVEVLDVETGEVLDTQEFRNFEEGLYAQWTLSRPANFRVTKIAGENAVVSAVLLGGSFEIAFPDGPPPPPPLVVMVPENPPSAVVGGKTLFDPLKNLKLNRVHVLPQGTPRCGSTGFCVGVLAMRDMPNGERHFLSDGHIYTSGSLYAFRLTNEPVVEIVADLGQDLYEEKRPPGKKVNGLFIDRQTDYLYFVGDQQYDTGDKADTILHAAKLAAGEWKPHASHDESELPNPHGSNNLWTRGSVFRTPDGLLARGSGCYYSIIGGGSWGPCLVFQDGRVLLGYPEGHRCVRPGDYWMAHPGWMGESPPVNSKFGTFTGGDECGGENWSNAAVWLDDPKLRGFFVNTCQGVGRIGYDGGNITRQDTVNRIYVYDPEELAKVRSGEMKSWEPTPRIYNMTPPPIPGRATNPFARMSGGCYDKSGRKFYAVWVLAYHQGVEHYPVLAEYDIVSGA
ncbi:MAG TPA: hypothetical protein VM529_11065 [Gemmata sp.]|nr:hypothetical protein [Gemmata sp.]